MTVNLGLKFDEFSILASDQLVSVGHVDMDLPVEGIDRDTVYRAAAQYWIDMHRATTYRPTKKITHNPDTGVAVASSGFGNDLCRESKSLLIDPQGYALSNPEVLGILRATRATKRTGRLAQVLGGIRQGPYVPPALDENMSEAIGTLAALRATFIALGEDQAESQYILMHGKRGETPSFYEVTQNGELQGPRPIAWGGSGGTIAAELIFDRYEVLENLGTPLCELSRIDTIDDAVSLAREAIQHADDHAFGCAGFSYVVYGQDGFIEEGTESFEPPKEPQYVKALERMAEIHTSSEMESQVRLDFYDTLKPYVEALVNESDQE